MALRLLPADFTTGADSRAALVAQARAMTVLSHPNVTTLFDAGEHDGCVYLAFEFLKGQSLRAEMAGRPLKVQRAVEAAIQIADAIADAHANGFVHGGLSPESVAMTQRGHAKIPAFELAAHGGFDSGGAPGEVRLLDYLSPEETGGQPADDRSDIYSVGAILYEMLTSKRPNPKGAAAPSASNHHVPPELDAIVLRAVAPNPRVAPRSRRPRSPRSCAVSWPSSTRRAAPATKPTSRTRPSTSIGRVFRFAAILIVIAGLAWWFWLENRVAALLRG